MNLPWYWGTADCNRARWMSRWKSYDEHLVGVGLEEEEGVGQL